ncbi:hypothetical protein Tco_0760427 [Tanacetum coccineum]
MYDRDGDVAGKDGAAAVREVVASDVWQRRGDGRVDGDSGCEMVGRWCEGGGFVMEEGGGDGVYGCKGGAGWWLV